MMIKDFKYYLLVLLQFVGIFFLFGTGPSFAEKTLFFVECAGILLGIWAVISMRIGNFNISPKVKIHGELCKKGPYRLVRHPMYLAIIITLSPLIIEHYTLVRLVVQILLTCLLILKIEIEERLLIRHFNDYQVYRKKTWKLLPFIY